jgi:hypothetical protein
MLARTEPGIQHAVARLLASPPLLERLAAGDTETLRAELALTSAEIETLFSAGIPRLRRFARGLRVKRMRLVAGLMPVTTAVLQRHHGAERVADEFWAQFPPAAGDLGSQVRARHMEWCCSYARRLSAQGLPAWLADLARYEEILERARRGIPAGSPGDEREMAAPGGHPCLRPGARLARFGYDVVTLHAERAGTGDGPPPDADPVPTYVAVAPDASVCRLGAAAFRLLGMCTGRMAVPEIASAALPDVPAERALAIAVRVIGRAASAGILTAGSAAR